MQMLSEDELDKQLTMSYRKGKEHGREFCISWLLNQAGEYYAQGSDERAQWARVLAKGMPHP